MSKMIVQIEDAVARAFVRALARVPESGHLPYNLILGELRSINHKLGVIMTALDDLKTAFNELATEAVSDLETVIAKIGDASANDAALAALAQQARDTTAKLKQDMATLTNQPVSTPTGTTPPA